MRITSDQYAAAFLGLGTVLILGCDDSTGPPQPPPPTTGAITIMAATTGVDRAPDRYDVEVRTVYSGSGTRVEVPLNGTASISQLPPATYLLTIIGLAPNCEPAIASPRNVTVVAGAATPVDLRVTCVAPIQLAFVSGAGSDADIYVVNSDGTGASRITTQPGADVNPAWSPDGNRIAFASERDGNFEIYVMNADGTNPVRLTNVSAADYRPAWSPDGARITFVSERDGNAEVYLVNADGTNPVRLTSHNARDADPAWSPDGTRIAFVTNRDGFAAVYVMAVDGSALRRFTSIYPVNAQPVWSPDGTRIALSAGHSVDASQIYVMNADGSDLNRLTALGPDQADPAWSPDGRKIVFTSTFCGGWYYYDECYSVIKFVRADGTPYDLQTGSAPSEPTWRP